MSSLRPNCYNIYNLKMSVYRPFELGQLFLHKNCQTNLHRHKTLGMYLFRLKFSTVQSDINQVKVLFNKYEFY